MLQCAYFTIWVVITLVPGYSKMLEQWMATSNIFNFANTLLDLMLYMYTIRMLQRSISKCVSFQFETLGTYIIGFIFIFEAFMQVVYIVCYEFVDTVIVYLSLLHFLSFFVVVLSVFVMMLRTGTGLVLVPHNLNNGQIQYEGYTKENKHLFTLKLNLESKTMLGMTHSRTGSLNTDSDCSENYDVASRSNQSNNYGGSFASGASNLLTEYDATERLLNLQKQFGKSSRPESFSLPNSNR